jgi:hypothetical protein
MGAVALDAEPRRGFARAFAGIGMMGGPMSANDALVADGAARRALR